MSAESNSSRVRLLVTTDIIPTKGDTRVEFFDRKGHYVGGIAIWANGKIWVDIDDMDEEVKFKTPQEFLQVLRKAKTKTKKGK